MNAIRTNSKTSSLRCVAAMAVAATLAAGLLGARPLGAQPAKSTGAAAEIETVLRAVLDAWETLDPAQPARFYAKDPKAVFFDLAPLKYTGWAEYEAGTRAVFANFSALSMTLNDDLIVHPTGNWAWATGTVTAGVTNKPSAAGTAGAAGQPEKMLLVARWTVVLEKRSGNWTIVHEHVSAPLEMPSPSPAGTKP